MPMPVVMTLATTDRRGHLLDSVTRALALYARDIAPAPLFQRLLGDLLALTDSEYGYIAEARVDDDGAPYLQTWAVTNLAWDDATRRLYEDNVVRGEGLEFRNLDTLFGWGLRRGEPVIANDAATDPRAGGVPPGHAALKAYLGLPLRRGDRLIGQVGVANRPGGYDEALITYLDPFVTALGSLIEGYRADQERREALEAVARSERELQALVGHLSDIVTVLEPDGSWRYSSLSGTRLLGYPRGYDVPIFDLLHPDDRAVALAALDEVLEGSRGPNDPVELRVRTADGEFRLLEVVGEDLRRDEAIHGVLITSHDVTERAALEAQRAQLLEDQREAQAATEQQNRSLRELAALKDDFVATVSHELRTPVTAVATFAELLLEDGEHLPADQREFAEIILRNAERLRTLVDDLLLLGRLESGRLPVVPCEIDLAAHVEAAAASIRPQAASAGVELTTDVAVGPAAWADPQRLDQVLANLLSNAVKFTPSGGAVTVEAHRDAGGWCLAVRDTGIGIPAGEQAEVFRRFTRGSNADDRVPGSGLGLVITRAIVERHGGSIEIASTEGEGTTVTVHLPDGPDDPPLDRGGAP